MVAKEVRNLRDNTTRLIRSRFSLVEWFDRRFDVEAISCGLLCWLIVVSNKNFQAGARHVRLYTEFLPTQTGLARYAVKKEEVCYRRRSRKEDEERTQAIRVSYMTVGVLRIGGEAKTIRRTTTCRGSKASSEARSKVRFNWFCFVVWSLSSHSNTIRFNRSILTTTSLWLNRIESSHNTTNNLTTSQPNIDQSHNWCVLSCSKSNNDSSSNLAESIEKLSLKSESSTPPPSPASS